MELLALIEDATSETGYGVFVEAERGGNVMRAMWAYIERHGVPCSLYVDRDFIHVVNRQATVDEELRAAQTQAHFERAMERFGVEVIVGRRPQGKGRVERMLKSWQDRLSTEVRLRGISTVEEANKFCAQST